ncbi:LysR family transcriptional regulator [Bacillus safensis]|uniref:HTH-type transcriptional regulator CynR n=1 Tax=Bacillus safensis TaxID=561879 RepID=A0A5C0WIK6_BACIA|nr:LysR family transcriptional regulator [Bacillus safensis]AYJ88418.1 LysR family transcriptional regulator [Bacillus safensis]KML11824.1 LysR family transcriptional regulator [Bacillus safensis]KML53282.1 LysR family transcriptional regulator [Bacillus safensis]KMN79246.1 LysR family transcriptional regulator [Bacillus safensis]MDI0274143.1 LysR family transcriptional regulator [Bacillus safensis]
MEIRAIRTFATIVKYGNFLKAAEALNYSQPTITLHIKHLEEEIGEKLLERGKTLKLTASGQLFYERANSLLNEYEKLTKTLQDLEVGIAGFIRIGVSEPTASLEFPALLAEFKERFPNVEFSVQVADANTLSSLLSHDEIDFAICGAPEASMENSYKPLFQDDIVLLVPSSHRLAEKDAVEVTDLENETILFTPHNCPIRIQIEQQIVDVIGTNYKKLEITSSMSHKHYVQAGLGVSLFTRTAHSFTLPGTKVLEIKGIQVSPPVGLLRKTNDTPGRAVLQFIDLIESRLHQHQPS